MRLCIIILFAVSALSCSNTPEACFTSRTEDTSVSFDASCSKNVHLYIWNFGDGSDTLTNEKVIQHEYPEDGFYTVTLEVQRKDGVSFSNHTYTQTQIIRID